MNTHLNRMNLLPMESPQCLLSIYTNTILLPLIVNKLILYYSLKLDYMLCCATKAISSNYIPTALILSSYKLVHITNMKHQAH